LHVRAFDRANVARAIVDFRIEAGPVRILIRQLHALDARQIDDRHVVRATARALRVDVVLKRCTHCVEPELEVRFLPVCRLHRRALPVLAVRKAHEDLHVRGMKAFDGRANREIAVATDGRIARRHRNLADRHGMSRQLHAEQQVAAAESPVRRTGYQQRHQCDQCAPGDQRPDRDATCGHDLICRRALGNRGGICRKQTQQRRRLSLRLAALAIEIRPDAAIFVRKPLFENIRALVTPESPQRTPKQSDHDSDDQRDDGDAARDRNRGRVLPLLQGPDGECGDCEHTTDRDRGGARIDVCAQSGPQRVQVTFESLSSAHFGVSRRIAR
jgi:hypothetical protein